MADEELSSSLPDSMSLGNFSLGSNLGAMIDSSEDEFNIQQLFEDQRVVVPTKDNGVQQCMGEVARETVVINEPVIGSNDEAPALAVGGAIPIPGEVSGQRAFFFGQGQRDLIVVQNSSELVVDLHFSSEYWALF